MGRKLKYEKRESTRVPLIFIIKIFFFQIFKLTKFQNLPAKSIYPSLFHILYNLEEIFARADNMLHPFLF